MNQRQRNVQVEAAKEQVLRNTETSDGYEADSMELYGEYVNGLENEVRAFYSRYTRNNQLARVQASKLLTGKEYSTWRKSLGGYLEELEDQRRDSQLTLKLNTLAAKSQVSRREQLLVSMYRNMSCLASQSETELTGLLESLVQANYGRKMFDIQGVGDVAWDMPKVDERLLKQVLSYPWSGRQYSKTLWDNTDQLVTLTRRELTLRFMSGAGVSKIAKEIDDVMGKGRYAAQRLVRTGTSHLVNQDQLLACRDAEVIKYRLLGGGYEICQRLNGQMFELSDARARENLPPVHPNCKCTTAAVYDILVFKQHQGNPLESNPGFEEWKKKRMEETGQVESGPGQGPVKKGVFVSLKERREATDLLQPYASEVKVTGEINQANCKKATAELERQLTKAPFQKLDGITIFDSRDAPGKIDSAIGKQLRMGTAFMNAPKKYYEGSILNQIKRIEASMGKLRTKLNRGTSKAIREAYGRQMELKRYSRGNVLYNDREIACVIQYEMMRMIVSETEIRNDRELKEYYSRAMKSGDIYGISYRVSENEREFICRAAVVYENGEPTPEYIKRLVKECKSHET